MVEHLDLTSKPEERNYSEGASVAALWVIKVSCIRFSLANIAIYNDLTFLFLKLAKKIMI